MNATLLLSIATLALVVGPLLDRLGRRLPALAAAIDGATVAGIVVVAFIHLLPEAGAHLSWGALALFGVGMALPAVGERLVHDGGQRWSFGVGGLVLALLLLHEGIESAALASRAYDERIGLATLLVVVGHRLPLGLFLWGHTRRRLGIVWSSLVLGSVVAVSLTGPMLVPERFKHGEYSAVLSALLAGGLLHLVFHHRPSLGRGEGAVRRARLAGAIGALVATAFFVPYLMGVDPGHAHARESLLFPERLWHLMQETAVPLSIGVVGAALIEAFLPGSVARWLSGGSRLRQALSGVAVGAPMPVCSCGVLPIYRSLSLQGVPPAAALALLVAAPEIGLDSLLLSLPMLGTATTIARLVCALLLALVIGLVVGRMATRPAGVAAEACCAAAPARREPWAALRRGLVETWGHLAPWILLGLVLTALVEPWISTDWAADLPGWAQVVVLSLAGLPTYICATAATPFAALLLAKGFTPGAVIAFLLTGPATNVTTLGALRRMHSRRVALAFVATALAGTFALAVGVDLVVARPAGGVVLERLEAPHGGAALVAAVLLGILTFWIVVREGPRGFLAQLWPAAVGDDHDHRPDPSPAGSPAGAVAEP